MNNTDIKQIILIAKEAGSLIMEYYNNSYNVSIKQDESEVTDADFASNKFITENIAKLSSYPIISEENADNPSQQAASADLFWLIDPLDGTKSFIAKNGDFTVNIALVHKDKPVMGVIYSPLEDLTYFTKDNAAYKQISNNTPEKIQARTLNAETLTIVSSMFFHGGKTDSFIKSCSPKELLHESSSIKLCMVAEGKADIYPRFGRTMEWDIAAGHAILLAAGGNIVVDKSYSNFLYGKTNFENPEFVAYGNGGLEYVVSKLTSH